MLALLFALVMAALPFKQVVNNTERVCFREGYFIINWQTSPLTVCEVSTDPSSPYCYLLNPLDTVVRNRDPFVRIFADDIWLYDLGTCWKN